MVYSGYENHHDNEHDRAVRMNSYAVMLKADFLQALRENRPDKALSQHSSLGRLDPVQVICDALCYDRKAASFIEAVSLTLTGQYEKGSKALIEWVEMVGLEYGLEEAEAAELE